MKFLSHQAAFFEPKRFTSGDSPITQQGITYARLATAFIEAFCAVGVDGLKIKSWQEYV